MKLAAYVKKMYFLNLLVALVAALIVLLFDMLNNQSLSSPYLSLMGFFIVFSMSSIDLKILKKIQSKPDRKYYWYLLSYMGAAACYLVFYPPFSLLHHLKWEYDNFGLLFTLILSSIILNTTILLIQQFILLLQEKARSEIEVSQLKTANVEAAYLLLRQQIQPHFLFNSLSNLKALYKEDPEAGECYIVNLANFLRISVSNQHKKTTPLGEEISFLNDYLEMQKIRFGKGLQFEIDVADNLHARYHLPSFSLQLLAENAIKHNELTEEIPLRLKIFIDGSSISVINNAKKKQNPEVSTGQGLANLKERYQLISGDTIEIKQTTNEFIVTLKLLSNEYIDN